jgi:hypothetical protein
MQLNRQFVLWPAAMEFLTIHCIYRIKTVLKVETEIITSILTYIIYNLYILQRRKYVFFFVGPKKLSLDQYLSKNTSEDNASFSEILEETQQKQRDKHSWLFENEETRKEVGFWLYFCCIATLGILNIENKS